MHDSSVVASDVTRKETILNVQKLEDGVKIADTLFNFSIGIE
jgi:hypothetical protein